jgi:pimeloyl-ACP methyl ester carboxylesterase
MGGLGALLYTIDHPEDIQGIYLVAPFLGHRSIFKEIEAAGGVRRWEPGTFDPNKKWQRMLWRWLKHNAAEHPTIPIYLGYGEKDRYVAGQRLLAQTLPPERVFTVPGGHDYESFRGLWKMFLKNGGCNSHHAANKSAPTP